MTTLVATGPMPRSVHVEPSVFGPPVELWDARIVGDSIIGFRDEARISVPLASVGRLQTRGPSVGNTLALFGGVVGGTLTLMLVALIITCPHGGCAE